MFLVVCAAACFQKSNNYAATFPESNIEHSHYFLSHWSVCRFNYEILNSWQLQQRSQLSHACLLHCILEGRVVGGYKYKDVEGTLNISYQTVNCDVFFSLTVKLTKDVLTFLPFQNCYLCIQNRCEYRGNKNTTIVFKTVIVATMNERLFV